MILILTQGKQMEVEAGENTCKCIKVQACLLRSMANFVQWSSLNVHRNVLTNYTNT